MTSGLPGISFVVCKMDPSHIISTDPGAKLCLEAEARDHSPLGTWGGPGVAVSPCDLGVCSGARLRFTSAAPSQGSLSRDGPVVGAAPWAPGHDVYGARSPPGHPPPSAWSLLQPWKTHVSLTALVTTTGGQPRGLELEGKLEEVTRDTGLYQKRGTFLLRSVQPLPLSHDICQEGLRRGGSRGTGQPCCLGGACWPTGPSPEL